MIRVVVTGGPSAGKTTLIRLLERVYGDSIGFAPEAATHLIGRGVPRGDTFPERLHFQKQIFHLQRQFELDAHGEQLLPVFCDRGSLDGGAYFEGTLPEFCSSMGTTVETELLRYSAVLHLQAASAHTGYTNTAIRLETPEQAAELDQRVGRIWRHHAGYVYIPNQTTFAEKMDLAFEALRPFLPEYTLAKSRYRYATAADLLAWHHRPEATPALALG